MKNALLLLAVYLALAQTAHGQRDGSPGHIYVPLAPPRGVESRDQIVPIVPRPAGDGWYYDASSSGWNRRVAPAREPFIVRPAPPAERPRPFGSSPDDVKDVKYDARTDEFALSFDRDATDKAPAAKKPSLIVPVQYNGGGYAAAYAAPPAGYAAASTYGGCTGGFAAGPPAAYSNGAGYAAAGLPGGYATYNPGADSYTYETPEAALEAVRFGRGGNGNGGGGYYPGPYGRSYGGNGFVAPSQFTFEYRPGLIARLRGLPQIRFQGTVRESYVMPPGYGGGYPGGYAAPSYYPGGYGGGYGGYAGGYPGGYAAPVTYGAPAGYGGGYSGFGAGVGFSAGAGLSAGGYCPPGAY